MRESIAKRLVKHIAFACDRAYLAHEYGFPNAEKYWGDIFAKRQKWYLKLAIFIHRDAALDQMTREGWWG